jgi:para-aminobenzoate synthetase/4-amino-4-deoxychorismate lyase
MCAQGTHRHRCTAPFSLLETLLWEPAGGSFLIAEHGRRLGESADYFDVRTDIALVRRRLEELANALPRQPQRVRLLMDRDGRIHREVYDCAGVSRTDCDDGVLWNTRGEITETGIANVVNSVRK